MRKKIIVVLTLIAVLVLNQGLASAETKVSRYTGVNYTHNYRFDNHVMAHGLDVSIYQYDINWRKVKSDGIDFAIIRVGGRFSGSGGLFPDDNFEANIRNAKEAGVMVGLYFFSQAINQLEAKAEAEYAVKKLEELGYGPKDLDLPIFMDYEFTGGKKGRLTKAKLTKSAGTKIAISFMETIKSKGYKSGIYANLGFLNKNVDGMALGGSYPIWAAQYYTHCQFQGNYQWWQYSSIGEVDGVNAKNDCNVWYINTNPSSTVGSTAPPVITEENPANPGGDYIGGDFEGGIISDGSSSSAQTPTKSMVDVQAQIIGQREYTYHNGESHKPQVSVTHNGQTLTEGVHYNLRYVNNTQAGQAHAMLIGIGEYTDYALLPFNISPQTDFQHLQISKLKNRYYTGLERNPLGLSITDSNGKKLYKGLDYTYSVSDNINAGTANLKLIFTGNYSGTKEITYKILKGKQTINLSNIKSSAHVGEDFNIVPKLKFDNVSVKYTSSNNNVATVSESGQVNIVGTGTTEITVEAMGNSNVRSAVKTFTLNIFSKDQNLPDNGDDKPGTDDNKPGTDEPEKPKDGDGDNTGGDDETTPGGDENPEIDKNFRIIDGVHATEIINLKAKQIKTGKIKITWKKSMSGYGVDYYQVWRSERKSSGYKKIFTTKDAKKLSYLNSKDIKSGKKYWYKIRGVRYVEDKPVYTPFAKVSVVTKKIK